MKLPSDYKHEIEVLQNNVNYLNTELDNYKEKLKDVEDEKYQVIKDSNYFRRRVDELKQTVNERNEYINELNEKIDELNEFNQVISRIIKERATAKRNIHPKKEHSGYLLIISNPLDYRYTLHGTHKINKIYQTTLRSPYSYDFNYEFAYKQIEKDLTHKNTNGFHILRELGAKHFSSSRRYEQLLDKEIPEIINDRISELIEEFKTEKGYSPYHEEEFKLRELAENEELYYFFNMDIRWNGKEDIGYWEVTFQSTCPIQNIPAEIRYKKGENSGTKTKI